MRGPRTAKTKQVWCTHCGGPNEVAERAMSVFCAHCHKRLILENLIIKTYQALKDYATCGSVVIEKRGRVVAAIRARMLTVKGVVQGCIQTRGPVEVAATGSVVGDVYASALLVRQGASLRGFCEIRPLPSEDEFASPAHTAPREAAPKPVRHTTPAGAPTTAQPVKAIVTSRRRDSATPRR